jgi:3-hydroxyacyl-CoA dehydrogenase/enoyl-CoA hydratase/3-hydroxybutyryl-CoA epimerase
VATAVAVGKKQGKTVIVVGDGQASTRRGCSLRTSTRLLASHRGLSVDAIDEALVDWGWPVGPFTLTDEVGIDVGAHVASDDAREFR